MEVLRAGCEHRFIDVANWILGAARNAKGLGVNTAREECVQPCEKAEKPEKRQKGRFFCRSTLLQKAGKAGSNSYWEILDLIGTTGPNFTLGLQFHPPNFAPLLFSGKRLYKID